MPCLDEIADDLGANKARGASKEKHASESLPELDQTIRPKARPHGLQSRHLIWYDLCFRVQSFFEIVQEAKWTRSQAFFHS